MSFSSFLLWLVKPSCPPIIFFICLFIWYFAGFTSELVCSCIVKKNYRQEKGLFIGDLLNCMSKFQRVSIYEPDAKNIDSNELYFGFLRNVPDNLLERKIEVLLTAPYSSRIEIRVESDKNENNK